MKTRMLKYQPTDRTELLLKIERLLAQRDELLAALKLVQAFINDLSTSNPGYLGKLVLQDYGLFNDAMIAMPRAIAKAEASK